jgi:hypothetical protein
MAPFTSTLLMVRPASFGHNSENSDNTFARADLHGNISALAQAEFESLLTQLEALGLQIVVLDDASGSPDAVFPNNWFSTHSDGSLILYPMKAPSRRREVRQDLAAQLQNQGFVVNQVLDWSAQAEAGLFLEGTGSLVLDNQYRRVYAALSERTDLGLVERWSRERGFQALCFEPCQWPGADGEMHAVYHTNVLMAVGQGFLIWSPQAMPSLQAQEQVRKQLNAHDLISIELNLQQVQAFAGNMLQVQTAHGPCLLMSQTAHEALYPEQLKRLSALTALKSFAIPIIEQVGGGSVRCMLAEIFLPRAESALDRKISPLSDQGYNRKNTTNTQV